MKIPIVKSLPKKIVISHEPPETALERTLYTLANTINELIDYLSDKEEVAKKHRIDFLTYSGWDRDELNELLGEEASKGEGCTEPIPHFHRTGCSNPEPHTLGSLPCCKGLIPPQQEESPKASDNPWLDKAHKMRLQAEEIMDKVNARINESPKEDEWIDDLYENFSSHWDKNGRSLETFIKANFVSKVKIKNQLSQVEKLFKSVGLVSSLTVRNIIKEVIKGLEELC